MSHTPEQAAPVVLPEPDAYLYTSGNHRGVSLEWRGQSDMAEGTERHALYTEQQVRDLLAEVSAPAAQMPEPAAKAVASNCFREKSECINNALPVGTKLYTEQQIRALLATSGQTQADAPDERKAFDAANLRDYFGDPLSYRERDIAFRAWQARAALAATQPVAQGVEPANCKGDKWLTVVYHDIQPGDESRAIGEHPKVSALSWSHALHDRDAALAAKARQ